MRTKLYRFSIPIKEDNEVGPYYTSGSSETFLPIGQYNLGAEQLAGVCCLISAMSYGDTSALAVHDQDSNPISILEQANSRKMRHDLPHSIRLNGSTCHYIDERFLEGIRIGCAMLDYDEHAILSGDVIGSESDNDSDDDSDDDDEEDLD